jgi:hypothetical protein
MKMGDREDASDGYGRSESEDGVKLKCGLGKTCEVRSSVRFRGEQRIVALDAISLSYQELCLLYPTAPPNQ